MEGGTKYSVSTIITVSSEPQTIAISGTCNTVSTTVNMMNPPVDWNVMDHRCNLGEGWTWQ